MRHMQERVRLARECATKLVAQGRYIPGWKEQAGGSAPPQGLPLIQRALESRVLDGQPVHYAVGGGWTQMLGWLVVGF